MSDAARHALYYVLESAYGTTPASPTMSRLRHTGTTLGLSKSTNVSDELRPDRQITDSRHGTKQIGGDFNFEFSYNSFDALLQAVLCGTWTPAISLEGVDAEYTAATKTVELDGISIGDLEVGDIVSIDGSDQNDGTYTVASIVNDQTFTVEEALVDEALGTAPADFIAQRTVLKAGTTRRSFTVMRHFSDQQTADKPFHIFRGVELNTMSLTLQPDAIVTGSFTVVGKNQEVSEDGIANQTLSEPTTTQPFDSFTGSIKEDGTAIGVPTGLQLTLENGLEPRFVLFDDETIQPSIGRSNLSGSLDVYFENSELLEKFIAETESTLEFTITDLDGNSYRFYLPNIKYNGGQPDTQGQGSVTLSMPIQALYDETAESQVVVSKIPA